MVLAVASPSRAQQQHNQVLLDQESGKLGNGDAQLRPRTREITSRYKSPSPAPATPSTSSARRFPSPVIGRSTNGSLEPGKRAVSAERRRLDLPASSAASSDASSRSSSSKVSSSPRTSSNASSRIWPPSHKLSQSMQSEVGAGIVDKQQKQAAKLSANGDHSLKPATNGVLHRGLDSPARRRNATPEKKVSTPEKKVATPERKSTPVRRLSSDHSENARPKGDVNRWPGGAGSPKASMSKSMDFTSEKDRPGSRIPGLLVQGRTVNCASRPVRQPAPPIRSRSVEGPLPESPSSVSRNMILDSRARAGTPGPNGEHSSPKTGASMLSQEARDCVRQLSDDTVLASSEGQMDASDTESISSAGSGATTGSAKKMSLRRTSEKMRTSLSEQDFSSAMTSTRRLKSLSISGGSISTTSWSLSPGRLSSTSQPPSPSKSVPTSSSPFRSMPSPTRTRISPFQLPPSGQSSRPSSLLNFPIRGGKKALSQQEEAQAFRLLHNRWLQWRFVNARAEFARNAQKAGAERSIYNAWLQTLELRKSVAMKRIKLQQARGIVKVQSILASQGPLLESWGALQQEHSAALSGSLDALEAAALRVPVTGGAKADVQAIREAMGFAVDVTGSLRHSLESLMPKTERMYELILELAEVAKREQAMLKRCTGMLDTIAALEVEERSLQTHFIQVECEKSKISHSDELTNSQHLNFI